MPSQYRNLYRIFLMGLIVCASSSFAQTSVPSIVFQQPAYAGPVAESGRFSVPLGSVQKVRGRVQAEEAQLWQGESVRTTWNIGRDFTFDVVVQSIQQHIEKYADSGQKRFHCASYGCGASAFWVNDVLEMPPVTGLDDKQGVWVWFGADVASVLYAVQRGNRDIYIHLQQIQGAPVMLP